MKKKTPLKRAKKKRSATARRKPNAPSIHGREVPDPGEVIERIHAQLSDTPRDGEPESNGEGENHSPLFNSRGGLIYPKAVVTVAQDLGGVMIASGKVLERYDPTKGIYVEVRRGDIHRVLKRELGDRLGPSHTNGVLEMCLDEYETPLDEAKSDTSTICLLNGVIDPHQGRLSSHDPKFIHRSQLPYAYDPRAKCTLWLQKLEEIFDGKPELIRLLQQIFGYCLTHDTGFQVFFVLIGTGANGKGVVLSTLRHLVGEANVTTVPPSRMNNDYLVATLRGKLVNIVSEAGGRRAAPADQIKSMVGEDLVPANLKYRDPIQFAPTAKHLFAANEMLRFDDDSYGLIRRVVPVPFDRTFVVSERDPNLVKRLQAELPGIFNWALAGLRDLLEVGHFELPPESLALADEFASTQNPVKDFVDQYCELVPGHRVRRVDFHRAYTAWHEFARVPGRPLRDRDAYSKLLNTFSEVKVVHSGDYYLEGIKVLVTPEINQADKEQLIENFRRHRAKKKP